MKPAIDIGDMIIIKKCSAKEIELNDIVEYTLDGNQIIHRVINITKDNGKLYFETKGDNNGTSDPLPVTESQITGKVLFKIPYLAYPSVWFHSKQPLNDIGVETGK